VNTRAEEGKRDRGSLPGAKREGGDVGVGQGEVKTALNLLFFSVSLFFPLHVADHFSFPPSLFLFSSPPFSAVLLNGLLGALLLSLLYGHREHHFLLTKKKLKKKDGQQNNKNKCEGAFVFVFFFCSRFKSQLRRFLSSIAHWRFFFLHFRIR
jgi:hypothetical protein